MIKLENFFVIPNDIDKTKVKVKFNSNTGEESDRSKIARGALDVLLRDNKEWLGMNSWRTVPPITTHYLDNDDYLITLAQYHPYGNEYYIFGGLFKVEIIEPEVTNDYGYKLTLMPDYQEYIKRLVIKVDKPVREMITRNYETLQEQLNPEIYEILKPLQ